MNSRCESIRRIKVPAQVPSAIALSLLLAVPPMAAPTSAESARSGALAPVPDPILQNSSTMETTTAPCCNLEPGDTVRLLVDDPEGAPNLPSGSCGFVVCCDYDDLNDPILVAWNDWGGGNSNIEYCDSGVQPFTPLSCWWLPCGLVVEDPNCPSGVMPPVTPTPTPTPPPYCGLQPGDGVQLLVDNPGKAPGLFAGACGFVVCYDESDTDMPILVSWRNWSEGNANVTWCSSEVLPFGEDSGWWVSCSEVTYNPDCLIAPTPSSHLWLMH